MKDVCATWFGRALSYCCESGDLSTISILSRLAWEMSHGVAGDLDSVAIVFYDKTGRCIVGHPKEGDTLPIEVLQGFLIEQEKEPLSCRVRDHALDSLRFFGRQLRTSITIRLQHCEGLEPHGEAIVWFGVAGIATSERIHVAQDVSRALSEWLEAYAGVIKSYRSQKYEIEALQASKREMMTIAHDVRAPISTLQYLISDLDDGEHPFIAEKKQICQELRYVDELLDGLSPKHHDRTSVSSNLSTSLGEVLGRVIGRFLPEAKQRGACIQSSVRRDASLSLSMNEVDLERILSNIIGNAVRYGGSGTVYINRIEEKTGSYSLQILDEGGGFPSDVIDALRGAVRVSQHDRPSGGWGVGLQATQRLLRRYGGGMVVSNTEIGGCVLVHLPLANTSRTSIAQIADECRNEDATSCTVTELAECSACEIVIVDDDREHALSLERIVLKKGAIARVFTRVSDALEYLGKRSNYKRTCVVCDVHMPDGGANTLLSKLQVASYDISCAVMSGEAPDEKLYQFAALGAREFFSKPIDVSVLVAWIDGQKGDKR